MTAIGILDRLLAVCRRDVLTAARRRNGAILQAAGWIAQLAGFLFLARAVGPGFRPDGFDYFSFLVVGTGFYSFLLLAISAFVETVREAQTSGTMEVLMTSVTPGWLVIVLSAFSVLASRCLQLVLFVAVGLLLFGARTSGVNVGGTVAVLLLAGLTAMAIGVAAAALELWMQRGTALVWMLGTVTWLFSGAMFPIAALPHSIRAIAAATPFAVAISALRLAVLDSRAFSFASAPVLMLLAWTVLLLPVSAWIFSRVVRWARRAGTLSAY
jgi:ABC-2 type transport system permease protein